MSTFYEITTAIKEQLQLDAFVNTVTMGDIFKVDLNKCMDIVDESKELITDIFVGNDNEQDVLSTQLMVVNRFLEVLRRGLLADDYELIGNPSIEFFVDRFENKIAGVTATFDMAIANTMTICN